MSVLKIHVNIPHWEKAMSQPWGEREGVETHLSGCYDQWALVGCGHTVSVPIVLRAAAGFLTKCRLQHDERAELIGLGERRWLMPIKYRIIIQTAGKSSLMERRLLREQMFAARALHTMSAFKHK